MEFTKSVGSKASLLPELKECVKVLQKWGADQYYAYFKRSLTLNMIWHWIVPIYFTKYHYQKVSSVFKSSLSTINSPWLWLKPWGVLLLCGWPDLIPARVRSWSSPVGFTHLPSHTVVSIKRYESPWNENKSHQQRECISAVPDQSLVFFLDG